MDNTIQILSELFPAKYHKYHLVETINGISIQTLSFYYYLIPFFLRTTLFYYFLLWEFNNWKIDFKISFSPLAFLLSSIVAGILSFGIMFLLYGHDIKRIDFNTKDGKMTVFGVVFSETIPFDRISKIELMLETVNSFIGSDVSFVHNLRADDKVIMNFNFGKFNIHKDEEFKSFEKYSQKLILYLKKLIKTAKLKETITGKEVSENGVDDENFNQENLKTDDLKDDEETKIYTSELIVLDGKLESSDYIDTDCNCNTKQVTILDKKGNEHIFKNYSFDLPDDWYIQEEENMKYVFNSKKYSKKKVRVYYKKIKCKCKDARGDWSGAGEEIVKLDFK